MKAPTNYAEEVAAYRSGALAGEPAFEAPPEAGGYYLFMSEALIRNNWQDISCDRNNSRPDIKDVEEWIALAKGGGMKALGATIVIQNTIPKFGVFSRRGYS